MSIRVLSPSEVAPPGFMDADPDAATAFAPDTGAPQPGATAKPAADGASTPSSAPAEPELPLGLEEPQQREPAPPRPAVSYPGRQGTRVYPLLHPVKINGKLIVQVMAHPPSLWDIQDYLRQPDVPGPRLKTNFELYARMVDMDPVALGALRWPDVQALIHICLAMLPDAVRAAIEESQAVMAPPQE